MGGRIGEGMPRMANETLPERSIFIAMTMPGGRTDECGGDGIQALLRLRSIIFVPRRWKGLALLNPHEVEGRPLQGRHLFAPPVTS